MIAITATELRSASTMPHVEGAIAVDKLEEMTGADIIISALDMPCKKLGQIKEHLAEGACLIQLKRGADLAASIMDRRLMLSLCRMRELTGNSHQRWLITTGILTDKENDDSAWFDGVPLSTLAPGLGRIGYRACCTALRHWQMRGGRYLNVPRLPSLPVALKDFEQDLYKISTNPLLEIYPDSPNMVEESDDPLQPVVRIKDWRLLIAALKGGIGPGIAYELYKRCRKHGGWALDELTDPDPKRERTKGITMRIVNEFRQKFRLEDDEMITVEKIKKAKR